MQEKIKIGKYELIHNSTGDKLMTKNIKVFLIEQAILIITVAVALYFLIYIVPIIFQYFNMTVDKYYTTSSISIGSISFSKEDARSFINWVYEIIVYCTMFINFAVEELYIFLALFGKNINGYTYYNKRHTKIFEFLNRNCLTPQREHDSQLDASEYIQAE